jgi:hypothetical protein
MKQIGAPPQSQKPLDASGFFSSVWYRFFLNLYDQAKKTNDLETSVNFSSGGQDGAGSNSEIGKKIDEIETRLLFETGGKDLTKRLDELEIALLFGSSGAVLTSDERNKLNNLSASGVIPYKIYDGKSVILNSYEYLKVEFTGEYIIEGTGSLILNGNSFLAVSGGGI